MSTYEHINTQALDGLRGLAAVIVLVGHFVNRGFAGIVMTLFYLLSGYSLTLAYGRRETEDETSWINARKFYLNRYIRTAPSFYISNLAACLHSFNILNNLGSKLYQFRWIVTITISNSWFTFFGDYVKPFNDVSWTISTLTLMYILFPWIITHLKKLSDASLGNGIVILYYIQLVPLFFLFGQDHVSAQAVSKNPLVRMPVFVMGILAGLQRIREADQNNFSDVNLNKNFVHDVLPWGVSSCGKPKEEIDEERKEKKWSWRVDRSIFVIIVAFCYSLTISRNTKIFGFPLFTAGHYLFVHLQVLVVQGLTLDGKRSFLAKLVRTKFCTFLGRISMAVYLYHKQVFIFFDQYFGHEDKFHPQMVVFKFTLVFMVGTLATFYIDEPARNLFKKKRDNLR